MWKLSFNLFSLIIFHLSRIQMSALCVFCLSPPPFQWWYRAELLSLWTTVCATQSIINIVEDNILAHPFTAAADSSHVRHCKIVGNPICGDKTHVSIACTHALTHLFMAPWTHIYIFFLYLCDEHSSSIEASERKIKKKIFCHVSANEQSICGWQVKEEWERKIYDALVESRFCCGCSNGVLWLKCNYPTGSIHKLDCCCCCAYRQSMHSSDLVMRNVFHTMPSPLSQSTQTRHMKFTLKALFFRRIQFDFCEANNLIKVNWEKFLALFSQFTPLKRIFSFIAKLNFNWI